MPSKRLGEPTFANAAITMEFRASRQYPKYQQDSAGSTQYQLDQNSCLMNDQRRLLDWLS